MKRDPVRDALDAFGLFKLSAEDVTNVDTGRVPYVAPDPLMQDRRQAFGVSDAFDKNELIDQTSPAPEPGVLHRAPG